MAELVAACWHKYADNLKSNPVKTKVSRTNKQIAKIGFKASPNNFNKMDIS